MGASFIKNDMESGTFTFLDPWGFESLPYMTERAAMFAVIRDLRNVISRLPNGQRSPAMSMGDGFERFGSFKSERQASYFWDLARQAFAKPASDATTAASKPEAPTPSLPTLSVPRVRALADTAVANGVKKIKIRAADNMLITLDRDGALRVTNPNILVTLKNKTTGEEFETGVTVAKIDKAGLVAFVDRYHAESSAATLALFDADPVKAASLRGHATGACCFCGRHLDTAASVQHGYGPTCAKKYRLPWGGGDNIANVARAVQGVI